MKTLPKWKMQGAAREKGDLIHTPKYWAGKNTEKGVEGGSKNREGTTMQLETAPASMHGSRRQRTWVTMMVTHCLISDKWHSWVTFFSLDKVIVLVYTHTLLWQELRSMAFLHTMPFGTIISRYGINISFIIWWNNFIISNQLKINHSSIEINIEQIINIQW